MGKAIRTILIINNLFSLLILAVAKIFYFFDFNDIKSKHRIVVRKHKLIHTQEFPSVLTIMLLIAEDRKYFIHLGIDILAIVRAIYFTLRGKRQGASTITQQYIRVLIDDYEISFKRKITEIFLALILNASLNKNEVINKYLSIAYFGYNMQGIHKTIYQLRFNFSKLSTIQAASIIARLKYPQRRNKSSLNITKLNRRVIYLLNNYNNYDLSLLIRSERKYLEKNSEEPILEQS